MPTSRAELIPFVVNAVRRLQPASILDVGVGFGKFGLLFREYLDVKAAAEDISLYERANWRTRLEGVEVEERYLSEHHQFLYDRIHVGDLREIVDRLDRYDCIWFGDVLEHFEKDEGRELLEKLWQRTARLLIVATPYGETESTFTYDNPHETHRSEWTEADWKDVSGASVWRVHRSKLLVFRSREAGWRPPGMRSIGAEYRKRIGPLEFWREKR